MAEQSRLAHKPDQTSLSLDRRRFLSSLSCGVSGVLLGPLVLGGTKSAVVGAGELARSGATGAASSGPGAWKMRLSCSSIEFASLPIEKACQRIA